MLFFLWGLGCNGKSTFVSIIRKLLGNYGDRVNTDLFMVKDKNYGGPKEGLANLRGKRFIVASEIQDGREFNSPLIKDITGGESVKADRKYEHEVEFQPQCKIWIVGNHKPVIKDTTLSIWRRMRLIPFTVTIPDSEIDPYLEQKLELELPGILTWAVRGCLDWQGSGFGESQAIKTATAEYRHDSDILGDFIEDCCQLDPEARMLKSELKEAYEAWCKDNGQEPVTQRTFSTRIQEKGVISHRGHANKHYWVGISLVTQENLLSPKNRIQNGERVTRDYHFP